MGSRDVLGLHDEWRGGAHLWREWHLAAQSPWQTARCFAQRDRQRLWSDYVGRGDAASGIATSLLRKEVSGGVALDATENNAEYGNLGRRVGCLCIGKLDLVPRG